MCSVKKTTQHTPVLESVFNKIAQALLKRVLQDRVPTSN